MSSKDGVSADKITAIADYAASPHFSAVEKACLAYADAMCEARVQVSDALFAELRTHLNARQIVELTSTIAWENYRARFNRALAIGSDGFSEGAACVLPAPPTASAPRGEDGA